MKRVNEYKWTALEEYWFSGFRDEKDKNNGIPRLPPMFVEFTNPKGMLIINDPDILNELYITKNKHFEKSTKMKRILSRFIGNSMLFDRSDSLW
jgi:hypothetical protein